MKTIHTKSEKKIMSTLAAKDFKPAHWLRAASRKASWFGCLMLVAGTVGYFLHCFIGDAIVISKADTASDLDY
jgi:hypothetical protein